MANRLSDDELRKTLLEYGQAVGPITSSTRSAWERRLAALRKAVPPCPSRVLNAFSSDDSEIESAVTIKPRKKRTSLGRNETNEAQDKPNTVRSRSSNLTSNTGTFKKPSPVYIPVPGLEKRPNSGRPLLNRNQNVKVKKKSIGKNLTFDVETSDSDFDTENPMVFSKSLRYRKKPGSDTPVLNYQNFNSDVSHYENSPPRRSLNSSLSSNSEHSIHFSPASERLKRDISYCENSLPRRSLNSSLSCNSEQSIHFSPASERLKRENFEQGCRTNGYLSNAQSNGEFHEEKVRGSSTNYSHCISWMLLIGVVAFFAIIGAVYMTEVQKSSQSASKNHVKFCKDLKQQDQCKLLILISRELHELLTTTAGEYDCDTKGLIKSRNLTVSDARSILWKQFSTDWNFEKGVFENLFRHSLSLISKNPEWGIKWYSLSGHTSGKTAIDMASFSESSALEAVVAAKSLWCRIRLSLHWTANTVFTLCIGAFVLFLFYCGGKLWKKRREAQEQLYYEMVVKVIDILEDHHHSSYQSDSNLGPYKAVVNIRDTLIPPKERKTKLWLWEKVVAFIEENESRVSVEYKTIAGEDFKVWRWNPITRENESGKQGKVWQGQAFNSLGKGKNATYSPTPCLKIRNMFDSEVEYGDEWQVSVQDAILEKCEGNDGIRHIAFDTSSNEGCVYLLCCSSEAAGKAFNALHGWWFDNKLVTVKYLRYERYLERFPEAAHCTQPLKPSNNKRLSLSTPFFSSALERS